jgi:hypothetical protein
MHLKLPIIRERLRLRAYRIARLIELKVPSAILTQELRRFQDQADKWHEATIIYLLEEMNKLRRQSANLNQTQKGE